MKLLISTNFKPTTNLTRVGSSVLQISRANVRVLSWRGVARVRARKFLVRLVALLERGQRNPHLLERDRPAKIPAFCIGGFLIVIQKMSTSEFNILEVLIA